MSGIKIADKNIIEPQHKENTMPTLPQHTQTETSRLREEMFKLTKSRLQHFAWRQVTLLDRKNFEFVTLAVQVYSQWRDIADFCFPNYDWQKEREKGIDPLATACVIGWDICGTIAKRCPSISLQALRLPDEGFFKAFILANDGVSVHHIKPAIDLYGY